MKNLMKSMKTIIFKLSPTSSKIYWLSLDFNNLFFLLVEDASSKKESHFIVAQCIQKCTTDIERLIPDIIFKEAVNGLNDFLSF